MFRVVIIVRQDERSCSRSLEINFDIIKRNSRWQQKVPYDFDKCDDAAEVEKDENE